MRKRFTNRLTLVGNSPPQQPRGAVAICFHDPMINYLFARLIEAHGLQPFILNDIRKVQGQTKVITEPQFFAQLGREYYDRCLVVGEQDDLMDLPALSLSRPLTEGKVESALGEFLNT